MSNNNWANFGVDADTLVESVSPKDLELAKELWNEVQELRGTLKQQLTKITKDIIREALEEFSGNQSKAARKLNISRVTLRKYMK